jgi:hypothetical protein
VSVERADRLPVRFGSRATEAGATRAPGGVTMLVPSGRTMTSRPFAVMCTSSARSYRTTGGAV